MRTCKACKKKFEPQFNSVQTACSPKCALDLVRRRKEQKARKQRAAEKRRFYADDVKTRQKAAKKACHDYIKLRDKGQPCICCGKPLGDVYHAGHFLESGNNPLIRYDEDNIHAQRVDCNYFKGGDSGEYEVNLIAKIGQDRVDRLKSMKGKSIKRTAKDYKDIEIYYKGKVKELLDKY